MSKRNKQRKVNDPLMDLSMQLWQDIIVGMFELLPIKALCKIRRCNRYLNYTVENRIDVYEPITIGVLSSHNKGGDYINTCYAIKRGLIFYWIMKSKVKRLKLIDYGENETIQQHRGLYISNVMNVDCKTFDISQFANKLISLKVGVLCLCTTTYVRGNYCDVIRKDIQKLAQQKTLKEFICLNDRTDCACPHDFLKNASTGLRRLLLYPIYPFRNYNLQRFKELKTLYYGLNFYFYDEEGYKGLRKQIKGLSLEILAVKEPWMYLPYAMKDKNVRKLAYIKDDGCAEKFATLDAKGEYVVEEKHLDKLPLDLEG